MARRFALLFVVASMATPATLRADEKDDLAQRAKAILKTTCYRCHGEDGSVEGGFNFVLDREQLVARKRIVPGDAGKSKLLARILSGEMPPEDEKPRPSDDDIQALKQWIADGARDFNPSLKREFLSPENEVAAMRDDLEKLPERDRRFTRYFTLSHLYNAGLSEDELNTYRFGLSKLINSLSWGKAIVPPVAVNGPRTLFRIDLRDYKWTEKTWLLLSGHYPYGFMQRTAAETACQQLTETALPCIRGDWFVANAASPPLYHDLLQIPLTDAALEKELRVDALENLRGERVARAGFNSSGVSRFNRMIERHETAFGAYWKSYDFGGATGPQNLFAQPLGPSAAHGPASFRHDGGEIIFHLPNGLQAYMLVDANGKRIDKAPTEIVSDPRRPDRAVVNGVSCMSCHARGMIPKEDQIRPHVEKNRKGFGDKELNTILALYPPAAKMSALMQEDALRFQEAVEKTGARLGATEPIVALTLRFEAELDLRLAAAEVGLPAETFNKRLDVSPALARMLGPLRIEGGTVQRQLFTESFGVVVRELGLGTPIAVRLAPKRPLLDPPPLVSTVPWKEPKTPFPKLATSIPKIAPPVEGAIVVHNPRFFEFTKHSGVHVNAVAFSPVDRHIAAETAMGLVSLFDPLDGSTLKTFRGATAAVQSLCFSRDGTMLAVGALQTTLWDVRTGKELHVFPGGKGEWTRSLSFSPDGKTLAGAGGARIRLWETSSGKESVEFPLLREFVDGLAFSAKGDLLASAGKTVRLWDPVTGRELGQFVGHSGGVLSVAFSPDGKRLVTGGSDKTIIIWDVASKNAIATLRGHRDPLSSVAFTANGKFLVSGAGGIRYNPGDLGEVKLWDVQKGIEISSFTGHTKGVTSVAISHDGRQAASAGRDRSVRLWDLPSEGDR